MSYIATTFKAGIERISRVLMHVIQLRYKVGWYRVYTLLDLIQGVFLREGELW